MRGREPAAFNFIDLTQCGDDNNNIGSTSAAPAAAMALLTPKVQPGDDEAKRAMPPPPARGPGQAHMMLQGSTSTANYNNNNNGVVFHGRGQTFLRPDLAFLRPDQTFLQPDDGISDDHCRAYLDQQDGGRSAARQRRRLERQPTQPAPDHNSVQNNNVAITHPTDVVQDQMKPDQTKIQLGNHLTLASTSNQQAAAEFDRLKRAHKEETSRQKRLMVIKQQEEAVLSQQRRAAMFLSSQLQQAAARRVMNPGGQNVHMQNPHYGHAGPPPPHPAQPGLRPLLPGSPPPPLMNYNPIATSINNMRPGTATVIPGSMNWMAQQRQQHFPAPNFMSSEGNRMAMHHSGVSAQLTIFYASMVGVFEDVPYELAQSICMMLNGKESKLSPPTLIRHPAPEPNLIPQPSLIPYAPSAPQSSHQAGPSQAAPSGELPQARKLSLARFLEKRRDRIRSKGNVVKEEEVDTTVAIIPDGPHGKSIATLADQHHPSSSSADQKKVVPTHVTSDPTTPPGTSSLSKRKFAPDQDLDVRRQSGEYVSVEELDVTIPRTTTEYVMREYQAVLKECDP